MSILVMCTNPKCGELFEAPDEAAGRKVRCPGCRTVIQVDAGSAPKKAEAQEPEELELTPVEEPEDPEVIEMPLSKIGEVKKGRPAHPSEDDELELTLVEEEKPQSVTIPLDQTVINPAELFGAGEGEEEYFEEEEEVYEPTSAATDLGLRPTPSPEERMHRLNEEFMESLGGEEVELEGMLDNRRVVAALFFIGLIGMVGGLLVGGALWKEQMIFGAFIGAGVGWMGGFILAFLLVLANYNEDTDRLRCLVCGRSFPAGTDTCRWCGAILSEPDYSELTLGCSHAWGYATSNWISILAMVMLPEAIFLMNYCLYRLQELTPALESYSWALGSLSGVLFFLLFAYGTQFLCSAIGATLLKQDYAPNPPSFWSLDNIVVGFKALGICALYIAPLFTVPLLPMAMLRLTRGKTSLVFNLPQAVGDISRHARDYAILWLWLLVWLAALSLSVVVTLLVCMFISDKVSVSGEYAETSKTVIVLVLKTGLIAAAGCTCGLAMFRCIGLFGRENFGDLFPQKPGQAVGLINDDSEE